MKHKGVYEKNKGSGVWYIRWRDENGKVQRKMIGLKKHAIVAAEQMRSRARLAALAPEFGSHIQKQKTLDEVMEFCEEISRNKPSTQRLAKYYRKQWQAWLKDYKLNQVTLDVLERWVKWRRAKVKPATVNRSLAYLRKVFNVAKRHGWVDRNPVDGIEFLPEHNKRDRFFSPEEMVAIIDRADPFAAKLIEIAVQTGMRQSEQFGLRREDVDFVHRIARISDSKAGGVQYVTLNDRAVELLREVLESHNEQWVFPSTSPRFQGHPMKPRWFVDTRYKPILKELGIKDANWHTLRHTFASWLRLARQDLKSISDLCRHSHQATTERYAHITREGLLEAANSIAHLSQRPEDHRIRRIK